MQTTKEKMKDSGIEWIGKIPQDWSAQKLKYVTRFGYGESLPDEKRIEGDVKVYGSNGVVGTNQTAITKGETIIVGRKGSYGKIQLSSTNCFPIDTTFYIDKTQTHHVLRWLYYVLQTLNLDTGSQDSTVPGLSREHAYNQIVIVPRGDEETRMASFLDSKTTIIDHAIEQKRKLIDLLKEKRTAIINRAVTRGLDENVELVDSGVEWIGKVPKSWNIMRLRTVSSIVNGATPASDQPEFWEGDVKWVTPEDLSKNHGRFISVTRRTITEAGYKSCATSLIPANSIILSTRAPIGLCAVNTVPMSANQGCRGIVPINGLDADFGYYYILSSQSTLDSFGTGSTFKELSRRLLADFPVPLPLIDEQKKIVQYLDKKVDQIVKALNEIERSIALLTEYRISLISHVVTGKVEIN